MARKGEPGDEELGVSTCSKPRHTVIHQGFTLSKETIDLPEPKQQHYSHHSQPS